MYPKNKNLVIVILLAVQLYITSEIKYVWENYSTKTDEFMYRIARNFRGIKFSMIYPWKFFVNKFSRMAGFKDHNQ